MRVTVRRIDGSDEDEFIAAAKASRLLHKAWVAPPLTRDAFAKYLARFETPGSYGFVVVAMPSGELVGAINITNIVRGAFQSGYLGYFAFAGKAGKGLMAKGLRAVLRQAFTTLRLHRLEANIQPTNGPSIALARACGFTKEGYSPAYLKIAGRWRDHERWAIVKK